MSEVRQNVATGAHGRHPQCGVYTCAADRASTGEGKAGNHILLDGKISPTPQT